MGLFKNKDKPTETIQDASKTIIKQYENVRSYKQSMGFEKNWNTYIDFVEDRQWEKTEKNKNMPKPMHNIIKFSKRAKTAAILAGNIAVMFSPVESVEDNDIAIEASEMFNNAIKQVDAEIDQEKLDYEVVGDAFTLGTGISHYFWDDSKVGGYKTMYKGSLDGETLDPMNVFPGNPQCKDKDKQPYWIVTYRDMVDVIKKEAKDNEVSQELIDLIVGDKDTSQEKYEASKHEVLGEDKTTVYMKYWRDLEDGKIYFEKATKGCLFKPKTEQWDYDGTEFEPYPIALFSWEDRKKSIFGIGEVEGMIYNQKCINFISAMQILNVQDTGWSKYIVKFDALKQTIQNVPGEVIQDKSNQQGDNIKAMQPAQMSNQAFELLNNMISNTRIFNGVSESITGESMGANMAASAIIALQNQAKVPLDNIRKKFFRYQKDIARIKEFFFKCKYNLPRTIQVQADDAITSGKLNQPQPQQPINPMQLQQGQQGQQPQQSQVQPNGQPQPASATFTGTKYKDVPLSLKIDVGAGSTFSESLQMNVLDMMAGKGWINKYEFAKFSPENVLPETLKHDWAKAYEQIKPNLTQQQLEFMWRDMPKFTIKYEDLPVDAQVQILGQMGIQSAGGVNPQARDNNQGYALGMPTGGEGTLQNSGQQQPIGVQPMGQALTPGADQSQLLQNIFQKAKVNISIDELNRLMENPQMATLLTDMKNQQQAAERAQSQQAMQNQQQVMQQAQQTQQVPQGGGK